MNKNTLLNRVLAGVQAIFRRPLLLLGITVLVIVALALTRPRLQPVALEERIWPVDVVTAARGDEQPALELYGEVVAGRRSELRALVPGQIVNVGPGFREGARVRKGDLIVEIDPFNYQNDLIEQRALLGEAEVRLSTAKRNLERIRELYTAQNVSEQNLDDALLAVEQHSAAREQARVAVARAERALQETRLIAPYDGVLNGVSADLGKQLGINDKVAEIIDTDRLEIGFTLSNAQFGRVVGDAAGLEGRPVEALWQMGAVTQIFVAQVERVGAEIDSTSGGMNIYATVVSDADTLLRPGAFVQVRLPDRLYADVFRIPESGIYGDDTVYVIDDGRMRARRVQVVGYAGNDVLFVPAGEPLVVSGDAIIITQIREGGDGIRVEAR